MQFSKMTLRRIPMEATIIIFDVRMVRGDLWAAPLSVVTDVGSLSIKSRKLNGMAIKICFKDRQTNMV